MKLDAIELQALLENALQAHSGVGASCAVYHKGNVIAAAAGLTNLTSGVPMTTDAVMHNCG